MVTMVDIEPVNDAKLLVIGCGGAGGNAVNTMVESGEVEFVDFVALNTDSQALANNKASVKIQIGEMSRKGLGCGAKPECGKKAAEEDADKIKNVLEEHDMVFITAGLGGGTGTGSAPVVAKLAKEMGILTVAVVSKPFGFEAKKKMTIAEEWLKDLKENVDSLIVISNQKIVETAGNVSFYEAFKMADDVLKSSVMGISDAIMKEGFINIDFEDVKTILSNSGEALIGLGYGSGDNKVLDAVKSAINNPLVENLSIKGARGLLINYTIGLDTTTNEIEEATNFVKEQAASDVNVIFGTTLDHDLQNGVKVTVIATRFENDNAFESVEPEEIVNEKITSKDVANGEKEEKKEELALEVIRTEDKKMGPTVVKRNSVHRTRKSRRLGRVNKDELDIPTILR